MALIRATAKANGIKSELHWLSKSQSTTLNSIFESMGWATNSPKSALASIMATKSVECNNSTPKNVSEGDSGGIKKSEQSDFLFKLDES